MRAVVQRVTNASITVDSKVVGAIDKGLLVYLGVCTADDSKGVDYLVHKIPNLRIFEDSAGKMNLSLLDIEGEILVVSQFTLCADLQKGNRPSFNPAAPPEEAIPLYAEFIEKLKGRGLKVATGLFGASMEVTYTNHGPVTLIIDY
ncbi:MAG: D-aminoacyl-tRNA deacylase [Sphaerochaetaceae bacterium]|jgi:D-tyrosyl-tRNA(Tyr) deacylase|nr:D-aminoacyl-tRNA deacylase [Sphaerochaetaceae bacterium]HHU87944.1 D-tyrosyl-tRNA(Tyr) deacylase [Spirochaetales bacterium]